MHLCCVEHGGMELRCLLDNATPTKLDARSTWCMLVAENHAMMQCADTACYFALIFPVSPGFVSLPRQAATG